MVLGLEFSAQFLVLLLPFASEVIPDRNQFIELKTAQRLARLLFGRFPVLKTKIR